MKKILLIFGSVLSAFFLVACTKTITISFDTNGAPMKEELKIKQGNVLTKEQLEIDAREGYEFQGWFTDKELTVQFVIESEINRNIILYAKWITPELDYVTISFVTNGGDEKIPLVINKGDLIPEEQLLIDNKEGHRFQGWKIDIELSTSFDKTKSIDSDLTLYAKWEEIIYYQVIFMVNGVVLEDTTSSIANGELFTGSIPDLKSFEILETGKYFQWKQSDLDKLKNPVLEDITLEAEELTLEYTVAFWGIVLVEGESIEGIIHEEKVEHGKGVLTIPTLPTAIPDHESYWDHAVEILQEVTKDLNVKIRISSTSGKELLLVQDGKVVAGISQLDNVDQILTNESEYWILSKAGYKFLGWFDNYQGTGTPLTIDKFKYSVLVSGNKALVYAKYDELPHFITPKNVKVTLIKTNDVPQIEFSWHQDPVNGIYPNKFILLAGEKELTIFLTVKDGVVTYNPFIDELSSEASVYLRQWLSPGSYNLRVKAIASNVTEEQAYDSEYSKNYNFVSLGTEDPGESELGEFYIFETFATYQRYVFITNHAYNYTATGTTIEVTKGAELFNIISDKQIRTLGKPGLFELEITRNGTVSHYFGLLIADIQTLSLGDSYESYLIETGINNDVKKLLDKNSKDKFTIGTDNEFYFDFEARSRQAQGFGLNDVLLVYKVFLNDVEQTDNKYYETTDNNGLQFKLAAQGKEFRIAVNTKYQTGKLPLDEISFLVTVQGGFNVYNTTDMRRYFADLSVEDIFIQRNFEAKLSSSDYKSNGTIYNDFDESRGNVFPRFGNDVAKDKIMVTGNYLTIDGTKLPQAKSPLNIIAKLPIINVQIGIFNNFVNASDENIIGFKNLQIIGSTATPGMDAESEQEMLTRTSGGHMGIVIRSGKADLNNVRILNTQIGVTSNAQAVLTDGILSYVDLDYVEVANSWSNSIFMFGSHGIRIKNSALGNSGGAAIHLVDTNPLSDTIGGDIYLEIDNKTQINNWINGDEAWFDAYGMQTAAAMLKASIDSGIKPTGRSIIKLIKNEVTGNINERMNLILITEPTESAQDDKDNPTTGASYIIKTQNKNDSWSTLHRPFNFNKHDPRFSDQFASAMGLYSETADFVSLLTTLPNVLPAELKNEALNIAILMSMYNATLSDLSTILNSIPLSEFSMERFVYELKQLTNLPRFLEVLAFVPGFGPSITPGLAGLFVEFAV